MLTSNGLQIPLPDLPQVGGAFFNGTTGGVGAIDPRNYLDETLPDQCPISRAIYWVDADPPGYTGGPIPAAQAGNVAFAVDPGGALFVNGWSPVQTVEPAEINTLLVAELFAGGKRRTTENFVPPVNYRPGDGDLIVIAPEIGTPDVPTLLQRSFLILAFDLEDALHALPKAPYLFNNPLTVPTWSAPPSCIANFVPGPPVAASQVRFHINNLYTAAHDCHWHHLSVGVQSGSSSSTIATPVPVLIARGAEYSRYPDTEMWTDWTDLAVTPGQNLLFKCSLRSPGLTNAWCFTDTGGLGAWYSETDSWNNKDMLGTVTAQPTRTHMIDRAQYR